MSLVSYGYLSSSGYGPKDFHIRIVEGRLRSALRSFLLQVDMDEKWYLEANSDVRAALKEGNVASARDHYADAGYFEDRWPRPIAVDEKWYRKTYPDIADAIRADKFASGQEHFELHGFREGRKPFSGWTLMSDASVKPNAVLSSGSIA